MVDAIGSQSPRPGRRFLRNATHLIHYRTRSIQRHGQRSCQGASTACQFRPVVQTVTRTRNESTLRSECLDHFVFFGERHLRHLLREFVAHYHSERYHQGIRNKLILPAPGPNSNYATLGAVQCRPASADSSISICARLRNPPAAILDTTAPHRLPRPCLQGVGHREERPSAPGIARARGVEPVHQDRGDDVALGS